MLLYFQLHGCFVWNFQSEKMKVGIGSVQFLEERALSFHNYALSPHSKGLNEKSNWRQSVGLTPYLCSLLCVQICWFISSVFSLYLWAGSKLINPSSPPFALAFNVEQ